MRTLSIPAVFLAFASSASAFQMHAPPTEVLQRHVDSGWAANTSDRARVVLSFSVDVDDAGWLRLEFGEVVLAGAEARGLSDCEARGTNSTLRITSMQDGASQVLSPTHLREWRNTSAYFNGGHLLVEVLAEPGTGANRVVLERVVVGLQTLDSQCGPTDDRVLSNDPRQARLLPVGCTGWMINDCGHCMLTAGHCTTGTLTTAEFNVPLSSATGTLVHPPPQDQYAVDAASVQGVNGGIGNDWGYFGVFANASTGLFPFQSQHAAYVLAQSAPAFQSAITIRITGYGVDSSPSTANQVQQTSTGLFFAHNGTQLMYQTDTEGGNSGSPVLWEQTGLAIGIHTHGGCDTALTGANSGTAIDHNGLQLALLSPHGVCNVACNASSTSYCVGKPNSQGCTPAIGATGLPSLSGGAGSFLVRATNVINQKSGILLYGIMSGATPFQGGTLCIASPLVRTTVAFSNGNAGPDDCSGVLSFDMGARIASFVDPSLRIGSTGYAQWWYRDPASTPFPIGLSNALAFTIGP